MVEVEEWVTGRGHWVSTRVDGSDVVACGVNLIPRSQFPFFLRYIFEQRTYSPWVWVVLRWRGSKQFVIESVDVGAVVEEMKSAISSGSHGCVTVHVTAEAARILASAVGSWVLGDVGAHRH